MTFLDQLRARRKKLADVLSDDEYSGIRQIVEDLYPDRAHFIYELLQNAEDTGATEVNFVLREDALTFEHNGRPFDEKDVEGITNIGKGAKGGQEDKIGRFGVGFKAVFAYTDTPYIWSPTYSFKISDLVLPSDIAPKQEFGARTCFDFPFNNGKKPREAAYGEVAAGLRELAETTLLFLQNTESIGWKLDDGTSGEVLRIQHSENHVEVLKQTETEETSSSHFLRFSAPVNIDGRSIQSVSVAYALELFSNVADFAPRKALSKQLRIISANPGLVSIFFPAEKEISGLRFHLHAPFVPELSRASIKETPANYPLFDQLAKLVASSLRKIHDLGLLTGEFLGVLPNPLDVLSKRYAPMRDAIIEAMNNEPLTPTYSKSHAPARQLVQAKASLKELLMEEDLAFLIEYDNEPPKWAIGASQRNSNQDRFLSGLAIKQWDVEQFVELLMHKASAYVTEIDQKLMNWLSGKSAEWHQQMYALLYSDLALKSAQYRQKHLNQLRQLKIVRLGSNAYATGSQCYFPSDGIELDDILPRVAKDVYSSGKSKPQQEEAKKFLSDLGVREVGEAEEIEGILRGRYSGKKFSPDIKDLLRFVQLVEKEPSKTKLISAYFILKRADNKWSKPSQVFLDSPFLETGLSSYYNALDEDSAPKALSHIYNNCGVDKARLVRFAKAVGINDKLPVSEAECCQNPQWDYLKNVSGEWYTSTKIDRDYVVKGLDKLLETPSIELSKLVWQTMCDLGVEFLQATHRKNWSNGSRCADSQLVHLLRGVTWVPQKDGSFIRPCDASRDQLPKGFPFDEGKEWLTKVGFGIAIKKRSEDYLVRNKQAQNIGFASADEAEKYAELANLLRNNGKSPDELILRLNLEVKKGRPTFPTSTVTDQERREEKLTEQLIDAPEKKYEVLERSVRTTRESVDPDLWLRNLYTNEKGLMVCQICKEEMPFRKRDDEYYFERVEALPKKYFPREHEAQFLALCPLCAAMYKEFVKQDEDAMETLKDAFMSSDEPEFPLQLGSRNTTVRFVKSHFVDIKTILNAKGDGVE